MLQYYKSERDAEKGVAPSGEVDCQGGAVERVSECDHHSNGFNIEFVLHTAERQLTVRTNSEDTFKLWVAAIVAAGGRAPLQKDAMGMLGHHRARSTQFLALFTRSATDPTHRLNTPTTDHTRRHQPLSTTLTAPAHLLRARRRRRGALDEQVG